MLTLDTNSVIYYLENDPVAVPIMEQSLVVHPRPFLATITELELFSFPFLTPVETSRIEEFVSTCVIVLLDSQIARIGARLRREYRLKTADSVVAATALFTNSTLLTRNVKDFKSISGLSVQPV